MLNMNALVGDNDIVFLTLDTLRFDAAQRELQAGRLPVLSQYISQWEERHSPGSFTYAAHQAFFSGFFPTPIDQPSAPRPMALSFSGSTTIAETTKCFETASIIEGLEHEGYYSICVGGVGFFNKQTPLGCVLPELFEESHWNEEMGVTDQRSTQNQVQQAINSVSALPHSQRVFLFMNISAIHQPNYFYGSPAGNNSSDYLAKADNFESHCAALRYVDGQLLPLFEYFKRRRNTVFFICSDHGTTYGESSYTGHRLAHEHVWTVPYSEFVLEADVHG